jgi:hypothetical protein
MTSGTGAVDTFSAQATTDGQVQPLGGAAEVQLLSDHQEAP